MYWKYGIAVEQIGLTGHEATNYASVVKMHLSWIESVAVGQLLFRAIARQVLFTARANLAKFNDPVQSGEPTRGVLVQPFLRYECNAEEEDSIVYYTPYLQGPCGHKLTRVTNNRIRLPHELLFHELVHALRAATGVFSLDGLSGGLSGYQNSEEFFAVMVTNIFATDPTNARADRVGIRRDHTGHHKISPILDGSIDFFKSSKDTFDLVEQFCQENRWFAERLAEVNATFNPVAAYFHHRKEAREASHSVVAFARDLFM